ncbi:alpha-beta hydrolase superfamily lysophospholipase [Gillisia sp. Hel_I_86]|uniref:alpha/beta hydrolase n=1 Tax=Gillisia sp. Hel_I_86 TaxID=1249981 RepID=UPI0011996C5A|nr:alpha/beta hydrolase [Gillisia sp. Hel_I_86]TVZ28669.1 alpha-beta hydrolase superfamily lysophospholipase [Gillisia sp. Hel_I_86]
MAHQQHPEILVNGDIRKAPTNQAFFPITNFHHFHNDANINFQLNRFLIPGLEDMFAEIGRHVENFDDWKNLFFAKAVAFEKEGNTDYAMELYRAAEFFKDPADPNKKMAFEKYLRFFYHSKEGKNLERMSVPYGNNHLHGFRLTPTIPTKGIILIHGGFDSHSEEFYTLGAAMCENGYEVIMFDGPGQGSTLMFEKVPMTHEWEKPVAAVLDYIEAQNVTLIGMSLGGYLAIRAASREKRVQRVIAYDVMLDFFACVTSRRGKVAGYLIKGLVSMRLSFVLNAFAKLMMKRDMYSQWGIAQGMHVMGCKTPYEFFFKLKEYNGYAASVNVAADVLIMAGAEDHFVPLVQFFEQLKLLTAARSVTGRIFTRKEQAQSHCQVGNLGLAAANMISWIEEHSFTTSTNPTE